MQQRVVAEALLRQQRAQVRVAVEDDAEHLVRLALVPVGGGPEVADRRDVRVVVRAAHLHRQRVPVREGVQVVDGLQLRQVVDAGLAAQVVELQALVAE